MHRKNVNNRLLQKKRLKEQKINKRVIKAKRCRWGRQRRKKASIKEFKYNASYVLLLAKNFSGSQKRRKVKMREFRSGNKEKKILGEKLGENVQTR